MGFGQAISTGFAKYFNFSDRARRSEFWYWTLFTVILGLLSLVIDAQLETQFVNLLVQLVTFIPSLAVTVRRLHDIDNSGWWVLISFVPLVGFVILVIWGATKGTDGPNRFGPDPLAENEFPNHEFNAPA